MRENGGRWEWEEGSVHIGGEDVTKVVDGSSLGIVVGEGAVIGLPIGLDEAVDVQSVDVVEEGPILQ